jgi:hypothetical protein
VVELCIHVANLFYLASFLGRDMLMLRALTCVGLLLGVVFFSCQKTPMYGPTAWHLVFLAINGVQIHRLLMDRQRMRLSREQARVGEANFRALSREELLTLLTCASTRGAGRLDDVQAASHQPLDSDERVLRDLAFSHLTRDEIFNLVTRRFWRFLKRRKPSRAHREAGREPLWYALENVQDSAIR